VSQGLWSEPVGPFVFGLKVAQEGLQSQFWFSMSCVSYRRSWTTEQGKVTEIGCEKNNATPAGQKQLQQNKKECEPKSQKTLLSLYIYE